MYVTKNIFLPFTSLRLSRLISFSFRLCRLHLRLRFRNFLLCLVPFITTRLVHLNIFNNKVLQLKQTNLQLKMSNTYCDQVLLIKCFLNKA
jgi:hypothetical protein